MRYLLLLLALVSSPALAQLESWATWSAAQPNTSRQIPPVALVARGENTDTYYVLEVDPTTGQIPVEASVSIEGASFELESDGTPGDPIPAKAGLVGGSDGTNLRSIKVDASGELQIDVLSSALPSGAATAANQSTANTSLSTIAGAVSGTEMQVDVLTSALPTGAATSAKQDTAAGILTTIDADTGTIAGAVSGTEMQVDVVAALPAGNNNIGDVDVTNLPTTVDTNSGAAGASTLRSVLATRHEAAATPISVRLSDGSAFGTPSPAGRSYADSARNSYSSANVTTGAWVQLIASTAATANGITVFDSSGQTLELGTGAGAAETRKLIIPPGGLDGFIPLAIPSGTRVSIRAVSGTASSGEIDITLFN